MITKLERVVRIVMLVLLVIATALNMALLRLNKDLIGVTRAQGRQIDELLLRLTSTYNTTVETVTSGGMCMLTTHGVRIEWLATRSTGAMCRIDDIKDVLR